MKGVSHRLDSHLRMSCSTVFLDISESFLDDAEQTQCHVRRDGPRHVLVGEYNLDSSLSGEFLAECRNSHSKPKPFKSRGMEAM